MSENAIQQGIPEEDPIEPIEEDWDIPDEEEEGDIDQPVKVGYGPIYQSDRLFYRIVAISLGATTILSVIFTYLLAINSVEVPDILVALGSGAIGALAGVLASNRR